MAEETKARIESELEVKAYIQDLKFSLRIISNALNMRLIMVRRSIFKKIVMWMKIEMKSIQIITR